MARRIDVRVGASTVSKSQRLGVEVGHGTALPSNATERGAYTGSTALCGGWAGSLTGETGGEEGMPLPLPAGTSRDFWRRAAHSSITCASAAAGGGRLAGAPLGPAGGVGQR